MANAGKTEGFITKLILQGALMLLEEDVTVQCRESDVAVVTKCLAPAAAAYAATVKKEAGVDKAVKLTIDKTNYLPPAPKAGSEAKSCLGGVVLSCQNGSISIDNTVDLRLQLVIEQDKPSIRKMLFPVA